MDYTKPKRQLLTHHAPSSPPQTPLPLPLPTKLSSFKSWKAARSSSIPIKLPPRPSPATRFVSTPTPTITPIGASSREPKPKPKPKSLKRYSSPEREYTPDIDADVRTSTSASTSTSPPDRPALLREKQATDREIINRVLREHWEARERMIVSRGAWRLEEGLMREGLEGQIEGLRREVERLGMGMGMGMNMDGVDDQEEAEEEEEHERFIHKEEFKAPSQTGERLSLDFEYAGSGSEPESESEGSEAGSDRTSSHREHETEEQASSTKDPDVKANVSAVESTALEIMPSPGRGASSPDDGDDLVELSVSASEFEPGSIDAPTLNADSKIECSAPTMIDLLFPTTPTTRRIPQNKEIWGRDYNPDSDTDSDTDTDTNEDDEPLKDKPPEEEEQQPPTEIWEHTPSTFPPTQSDSPNPDHDPHETIHLYSILTTSLIFAITTWMWFGLVSFRLVWFILV